MPQKQALLLSTAEALFRLHGIRRVTVEEVCSKAGVSKVTFYKYFANRNALALAVLERMIDHNRAETHALLHSDQPFAQRLQALLALKHSIIDSWGPALIEDIMTRPSPEVLALLMAEQEKSLADTHLFLKEGYASGALNPAIPENLIFYLMQFSRSWFNDAGFVAIEPNPSQRAHLLTTLLMTGICMPAEADHA
jgi:AcrR family transcriptional regulator